MQETELNLIGKRMKDLRVAKEYKLTEIAQKASVSKGLLSKIENGRTIPSVPVLLSLIHALGENPSTFFEGFKANQENTFYFLIKKNDYKPELKEDSVGFNYFSVFSQVFNDIVFKVCYLELEPEAKRDMVSTDGMEFIFLIEGNIKYRLKDETIELNEGDSLFFDGRVPHVKLNPGVQKAKILVIYLLFNHN
jgi:transcriptional regulator with XRE-family HTH domain